MKIKEKKTNKIKNKSAISLIVLIITILILSILASAVILSLSNTNIITHASDTVFKSDLANYQQAYEMYLIDKMFDNDFNKSELNVDSESDEYIKIFGNVPDKYKEKLKIMNGELVYLAESENEKETVKNMGIAPSDFISKDESFIGVLADIDGDGNIDGIIFADLCIGADEEWTVNNGNLITTMKYKYDAIDKGTAKNYYISYYATVKYEAEDEGEVYVDTEELPVLTAVGDGVDRFYVLSLEDENEGEEYYWYYTLDATTFAENCPDMDDPYDGCWLAWDFGEGKRVTKLMINGWNEAKYGAQNAGSSNDLWGAIQSKVKAGWFVPSYDEWTAICHNFGVLFEDEEEVYIRDKQVSMHEKYWTTHCLYGLCNGYIESGELVIEFRMTEPEYIESQSVARARLATTF